MGWRMGFGCVTRWEGMADLVVGLSVVLYSKPVAVPCAQHTPCQKHEAIKLFRGLIAWAFSSTCCSVLHTRDLTSQVSPRSVIADVVCCYF